MNINEACKEHMGKLNDILSQTHKLQDENRQVMNHVIGHMSDSRAGSEKNVILQGNKVGTNDVKILSKYVDNTAKSKKK